MQLKTTSINVSLYATILLTGMNTLVLGQESATLVERYIVESDGWELVGDLTVPSRDKPVPVALLLNQADGDRTVYEELATSLSERGIASLRLDLRGHGQSTNLGRFVPGEQRRSPLIWDAETDVIAAVNHLKSDDRFDANRIAIVGASYSGEEMAEAGRLGGYVNAYVVLSPGSFSDESIDGMDASKEPWLFIVTRDETFLKDIARDVIARSSSVDLVVLPGRSHATDILDSHPHVADRIAVWLAHHL